MYAQRRLEEKNTALKSEEYSKKETVKQQQDRYRSFLASTKSSKKPERFLQHPGKVFLVFLLSARQISDVADAV